MTLPEGLREMARHSGARIMRMPETGSLEISLRKFDHSALVVIKTSKTRSRSSSKENRQER